MEPAPDAPPAQDPVLVELDGVAKTYGPVQALRGLTGAIRGRLIGLLGPNGAGKSTLLKVLLGLTPFTGSARVLGLDARRDASRIRDRVGFMPETDSYLPEMNAVELCAYAAELSGLPRVEAMQRAHAALFYANLEDKRYLPVEGYSTGMKQRVKLAQALVHDPDLLFLDEPTNGLDPGGREEMLALIAELPRKRGCAVILSTHLLPDVERICDHAIVMQQGQVLFTGTIDELRGGSARPLFELRVKAGAPALAERLRQAGCTVTATETADELVVELAPGSSPRLLFREARAAAVQIRHLAPRRASLETAFLRTLEP